MNELLPSKEIAYQNKIRELMEDKRQIYAAALRRVTSIINLSDLSEEQKKELLSQIWED